MSPILVGVAFAVTAGAVVAVSAREARVALVGLAVAMAAAPFLADPLPPLTVLATRVVGAALAAYLLRAAVASAEAPAGTARPRIGHGGSRTGWPAETLLALAAWIVGLSISIHLEALNPAGPGITSGDALGAWSAASAAAGAGLAAIVIAIVPAVRARDGFRTAVGLLVLIMGIMLLRTGVAGAPGDLEQLTGVALAVAAAITGSILIALEAGHDDDPDDQAQLTPQRSTGDGAPAEPA
ncbi:MAG: hypothetical protein V4515_11955 [Chloroflexota bacterium]